MSPEKYQDYRAELEALDREIGEIARASDLLSVVSGSSSPSEASELGSRWIANSRPCGFHIGFV